MSWTNAYIGIPYEINGREMNALDCWGLVRQVYSRELGIELPSYAGYNDSLDGDAFAAAFGQENSAWKEVEGAPKEYDVAWCRIVGVECHCGVILGNRLMLHSMEGVDSCIVSTSTPAWQRRILRCYRIN
jgi:cell wall-associated NlpC family hydrolase